MSSIRMCSENGGRAGVVIGFVMPGLVPGIHVFLLVATKKTWMAGTGPAMTS
jgi:hypothetical protein